jgi:AcrR family transcriptional regulator
MSPEQRRAVIIQAAIPLIAEDGAAVTTAKIARAAGIGEDTIFHVFADKDELLQACLDETLSPEQLNRGFGAIDTSLPLPDRLAEAVEVLQSNQARMVATGGALLAAGYHPGTVSGAGRDGSTDRTLAAVVDLLEPDRAALRRPPEQIANLFFGFLVSSGSFLKDEPELTTRELVEILLHGALADGAT